MMVLSQIPLTSITMSSSSLHPNLTSLFTPTPTTTSRRRVAINCGGPRSNRGPLVKGRILSIEAIHAIQALKRAYRSDPNSLPLPLLSRLLKSDLLSSLKELLRQRHLPLALAVFSAIRAEYFPALDLYAALVNSLSAEGLTTEIDCLVADMEKDGAIDCLDKGLVSLVKALVQAERREATVKIYALLKRSGWGGEDEYVAEVLSRGLRRMGEEDLADEIDIQVKRLFRTNLAKPVF